MVGLTESQANERLKLPPAASPTTSPRFANASRKRASSSRETRMARRSTLRRAESLMHWCKKPFREPARGRGPSTFPPASSPTSGTGLPRPGARGASTRASSWRSRPRASAARTTRVKRCTTCGSRRAQRSSAARGARSSWWMRRRRRSRTCRASAIRARRTNMRAPARGGGEPRLLGAGQGRPEDLPPRRSALLRDPLDRSGRDRRDDLRPHRRRTQAARCAGGAHHRAQSRNDDRAGHQYATS